MHTAWGGNKRRRSAKGNEYLRNPTPSVHTARNSTRNIYLNLLNHLNNINSLYDANHINHINHINDFQSLIRQALTLLVSKKLVKEVSKIFEFVDITTLEGEDLDTATAFILEAGISVEHYKTMRSELLSIYLIRVATLILKLITFNESL